MVLNFRIWHPIGCFGKQELRLTSLKRWSLIMYCKLPVTKEWVKPGLWWSRDKSLIGKTQKTLVIWRQLAVVTQFEVNKMLYVTVSSDGMLPAAATITMLIKYWFSSRVCQIKPTATQFVCSHVVRVQLMLWLVPAMEIITVKSQIVF